MKWTVALIVAIFLGCQTPPKHHRVIHHHHHKSKPIVAVGDDAAIDAIIKSLRE